MTHKIDYTISTDTANGAVEPGTLHQEIEALDISGFIGTRPGGPDIITIEFENSISGADETALDAVIAAHLGVKVELNPEIGSQEDEASTNTDKYQPKYTLTVPPLSNAATVISWYFECLSDKLFEIIYRIQNVTDNETLAEATTPRILENQINFKWIAQSGFAFMSPSSSATKVIELQIKTDKLFEHEAKVRRVRMRFEDL